MATTHGDRAGILSWVRTFGWRTLLFRGVVLLLAYLVVPATINHLLLPWRLDPRVIPNYTPEMHRWHGADVAALIVILVCGGALALVPRPRSLPLLAQFTLVALGIFILTLSWPFRPEIVVPCVVVGLLFAATYPDTRALLTFPGPGNVSRPLLALATAAAVPLLLNAWYNLRLALTDLSEHAHFSHWNVGVGLPIALLIAGFLVATRRPGWRALGAVLGVAYLYLGVSAQTIPVHDGSWGLAGGGLSLIGAAGFLGLTLIEGRRGRAARH
jgi:hypothetical protein